MGCNYFYCTSNSIYRSLPMGRCKEIPAQFNTIFFVNPRDCSCNETILKLATWPIRPQLQNLDTTIYKFWYQFVNESNNWIFCVTYLSEITTSDLQVFWHQTTEVNNVTCFLFQCCDCTSFCHSVEKFPAKSTWRATVSWLPISMLDLHMFWIAFPL